MMHVVWNRKAVFVLIWWSVMLLLLPFFDRADGFAAWLVDRKIGCWTYLTEGEVIMNSKVKAASDSRHPDIHLQVFRDGELMEPEPSTSTYPILSEGETLQLKLFTPQAMERVDTQFVVETTAGAEFTAPYVGCEGKRSAGKSKKAMMTLKFTGEEVETIEVVAGWATGHSAVTLTPKLIFKREDPGKLIEKQRIESLKEVQGEAASTGTIKEEATYMDTVTPTKLVEKATGSIGAEAKLKPRQRKHANEEIERERRDEHLKTVTSENIDKKRKSKISQERHSGSIPIFHKLQRVKTERNNDDFGSLSFSMRYFLYACVFSLLFILGVIYTATSSGANGEQKDL